VAAILHYRLALASYVRVGVKRRLLRLAAHGPCREAGAPRVRHRIACVHVSRTFDSTVGGKRAVMCERASRPPPVVRNNHARRIFRHAA